MEPANLKAQLIEFLREEIGEYKKQINSDTLLEDDLGVTGNEAVELIKKIAEKFNVDINTFEFKKYFHPEPTFFTSYQKVMPLTIRDLESAIKNGKLV